MVKRSWIACGHKAEKDLTPSNEGDMVVRNDEHVDTMVEELCGEEVHTNFEDPECGQEPAFLSDDESSSDGNEGVDDDDVEEVDSDQAPLATRAPVRAQPRSPVRVQVGDHRYAAGDPWGKNTTSLNENN